ncbi:ABC transporter substrate-binding protein [Arthrobacter sp. CJ23]|uniref:ABC transporter substrate-binding protein n=1 Tax=Arthrobacter sp. CJ23 TaxID=2972479 RepID=UPI00215BE2D1|nr:iron-siderophore ABC transporter substrate-binding protein [Arthrobacter sp. CJ23]UVJ40304.1 iron-siderophore ABC transporter substrate-binding protein [Arthrobacter sp. CJ23]
MKLPKISSKVAAVATAAALLAVTACGAPESAPASTGEAAAGFPKTVSHVMGATEIKAQPKRVVALDSSYIDATLLLGAELVGYIDYRQDPANPFAPYLGDVKDATKESKSVGTLQEPNLEKILELKPDLIVSAKVRHEAIYPQLSKIAPTIFSESTGPTWKQNVVFLGDALGEKAKAEKIVADYEHRAKKVGAAILAKDPAATYSLLRFAGEDTARLYSSTSFIGAIMADMGIPRPKDGPDTNKAIFVPLSQEQILQAEAKVIFVSAYTPAGAAGDKSRAQVKAFEGNPLWSRLAGKKVSVDDGVFLSSVSIQGANEVITQVAKEFGVDAHLAE